MALQTVNTSKENIWLLDSGCTSHMTKYLSIFSSIDQSIKPKIKLGNGDIVQAKGKGSVTVNTTKGMKVISNVLYIPELDQNILSVAQMLKNGYEVSFKGSFCFITDSHDSAIAKIKMEGNSFYLNMDVVKGHVLSAKSDESVLWQKRDGHANLNSLKVMHNSGMINDGDQFCKRLQISDKDGKIRDGDLYSMESNNVYVNNSAESTTHEGMKDVFNEHGAITSAVMMRAADEKSKCFEFVNFKKVEDAAETVKILNGKEIDAEESYVREWYMKTGGATFEGNPDGDLGQNKADISLVHHDLKTKIIPVASLEFLKMKLGLPKANLKEEC